MPPSPPLLAKRLGLRKSKVSRRLAALEERLGD
jgi:DNA-binding transcriptional LysR family regulator